ncbi:MAG: processive 1,2-diacylglycerol beta-glucosyltransferase [Frankiaceae bacterium]|jgi:UDP-N-acetylglucosamine:LPS N-acetylglucosamine transferase|nr:processive 1,2-diacylglycerol beta-glucosyltransferase [Frankiaceae bacterium]
MVAGELTDSRHALLVSGSIGMGHDVMADAFAASLAARGWTSETLDAMALLGGAGHRAGESVFRALLGIPGTFDALHFHALRGGNRLAGFLDNQAARRIAPRLSSVLRDSPAPLVVSVFATAASAMSRVRADGVPARTVTFCTDVNPHRLWVHPNTDIYLVPSPTSAAFLRRFEPEARVLVVPAPVRSVFYDAPSRADARAALGVPADAKVVLLMTGSWGLGPLADVARSLAAADVYVLAVAGRAASVEAALRTAAASDSRIVPFGFTDRVPELMAACDVVVTSAGDTCSEARVIGRRMVLLDVVAGHGRENLQHELELGDAVVASTSPDLLVRGVLRALANGTDPTAQDRRTGWEAAVDEIVDGL